MPIYPVTPVAVSVSGTSTTATTVLISTTDCGITDDCVSQIVGIDTTANAVSNTFALTATPNSIVFDPTGTKAFVGTDKSLLGAKGLMTVDLTASPTTITNNNGVAGKVLAVSPDGIHVIVSDTADTVNQVFIFSTSDGSNVALPITGATAASYSPDNLKVFIAAGSKLYIYSTQDALQTAALGAPATGVVYLTGGMGAYVAGGDPAGLDFFPTCGSQPPTGTPVTLAGTNLIQPLPDGVSLFTVQSPSVQLVNTQFAGLLAFGMSGCPSPRGGITVSGSGNGPIDLGQGAFTPTQLIVSADGSTAYILTSSSPNILVFDINNRLTTAIQLANNAIPLQAALTTDGKRMYVAGSDGAIHVLDTPTTADTTQITLPQPLCTSADGTHTYHCTPNLIAIKP
jgi:WD40 repeat protein